MIYDVIVLGPQFAETFLVLLIQQKRTKRNVTSQLTEKYINSKICIFPSPQSTFLSPKMSSIASFLKHASDTTKAKDLSKDTVEITSSSGLTTDHGVKVSDTDNWYGSRLLALDQFLIQPSSG